MAASLDARAKPPARLRDIYKQHQKLTAKELNDHPALLDTRAIGSQGLVERHLQLPTDVRSVFSDFLECKYDHVAQEATECPVYEVVDIPALRKVGLLVYPSLLPPEVQIHLLEKLLHRDIANPQHLTNVHLFHNVTYPPPDEHGVPKSFFDESASSLNFGPIDPNIHKPFSVNQFMNKKLRWATLGGQYDWTNKVYPDEPPPDFPPDTKELIEKLFPMKAEAAILNLYSPGDTLSLHRDVSEECDQPLVSISIGCDAVFIVGLEVEGTEDVRVCTVRLRSGDAVLMHGESRYAWHAVPKVIEGTCPHWLEKWPANDHGTQYEQWRGWMNSKRINLNVRQMFDANDSKETARDDARKRAADRNDVSV